MEADTTARFPLPSLSKYLATDKAERAPFVVLSCLLLDVLSCF